MLKKGTKLYSILFNKCPRCQKGDFMKEKNPFKLNKAYDMHSNCVSCGFKFMIEPSFFYGAMYVNYALTVGLSILTFLVCVLGFHLSMVQSIVPIIVVLLITLPLSIRLSRIIWINFFIKYDLNATNSNQTD